MQQFSATPKNQDVGRGLRKIVACSQSFLNFGVYYYISETGWMIVDEVHYGLKTFPYQRVGRLSM